MIPSNPTQISAFAEGPSQKRRMVEDGQENSDTEEPELELPPTTQARGEIPESECEFTSIQELRRAAKKRANLGEKVQAEWELLTPDLAEIMAKHTFVGVVDHDTCLSCIQQGTRLFLVNHAILA